MHCQCRHCQRREPWHTYGFISINNLMERKPQSMHCTLISRTAKASYRAAHMMIFTSAMLCSCCILDLLGDQSCPNRHCNLKKWITHVHSRSAISLRGWIEHATKIPLKKRRLLLTLIAFFPLQFCNPQREQYHTKHPTAFKYRAK